MIRRVTAPLAIAVALALYPPLVPFVVPGVVLVRARVLGLDRLLAAALVPVVSAAFWSVAVQWLRWLGVPLGTLALVVTAASLLGYAALPPAQGEIDRRAAVLLAVAALLRLSPLATMHAPAGADMSMHTAMARLIADANGWPASQRPYLPIDSFGSYPLGFHMAVAIGLRGGGDVMRTALFAACAVQALAPAALFAALSRLGVRPWPAAVAAAVCLYGCSLPQTALAWGGAPTVLGWVLLFGAVALVPRPEAPWRALPMCALVTAGAASAHLIPVATGLYALGPAALMLAWWQRRHTAALASTVVAGAGALALLLPYLLGGIAQVSPFERQWVRDLISAERGRVLGSPLLFSSVGPVVPLLAFLGLLLCSRGRRALALAAALAALGAVLCFLGTYGFWLPQSELLYPTRIGTVLDLPLGLGVAWLAEAVAPRRVLALAGGALVAAFGLFMHVHEYQMGAAEDVVVTDDDRAALAWIEAQVAPAAMIANNYGDAGLWIPAVARRQVTRVHGNPFYFSEYLEARKDQRAEWVYVGAKWTYERRARPWQRAEADRDPRLALAFAHGDARVYRVVGEPIAVAPLLPPPASSSAAP